MALLRPGTAGGEFSATEVASQETVAVAGGVPEANTWACVSDAGPRNIRIARAARGRAVLNVFMGTSCDIPRSASGLLSPLDFGLWRGRRGAGRVVRWRCWRGIAGMSRRASSAAVQTRESEGQWPPQRQSPGGRLAGGTAPDCAGMTKFRFSTLYRDVEGIGRPHQPASGPAPASPLFLPGSRAHRTEPRGGVRAWHLLAEAPLPHRMRNYDLFYPVTSPGGLQIIR